MAPSVGLASFDASVFSGPYSYDHKRENLLESTLNFNRVGFSPTGAGRRNCPGRNFAFDLLVDTRNDQSVASWLRYS